MFNCWRSSGLPNHNANYKRATQANETCRQPSCFSNDSEGTSNTTAKILHVETPNLTSYDRLNLEYKFLVKL
jgi:hypothetical protein